MSAPRTYIEYKKAIEPFDVALYAIANRRTNMGYTTKVAQRKVVPETVEGGCAANFGRPGTVEFRGDLAGNVYDYDESWLLYSKYPTDPAFFQNYLFPWQYFITEQQYVARALQLKPDSSASIGDKAAWAIDIMSHVNWGLLATNLSSEVLGELTLINSINSVHGDTSELNSLAVLLASQYGTHPLWTYARKVWKQNSDNAKINPLLCAEFTDLLLPSSSMSSLALSDLYNYPRRAPAYLKGTPCPFDWPVPTWQEGGKYVAQILPWVKGGYSRALSYIHKELYGSTTAGELSLKSFQALGLEKTYRQWMLLMLYRAKKWWIDEWIEPSSSRIYISQRFIPLPTFLKSLEDTPRIVPNLTIGAGKNTYKADLPNFAYIYFSGGIDAWARYFCSLRYKEFIEVGAHAWGQNVVGAVSCREMQEAIKNIRTPRSASNTLASLASFGIQKGATALKSLSASILDGNMDFTSGFKVSLSPASISSVFGFALGIVQSLISDLPLALCNL
jgi:hypothetical protein